MLSIAKVPLPNSRYNLFSINGFLGYIYDSKNNKFFRFGTYTGALVSFQKNISQNEDKSRVMAEVRDWRYVYSMEASGSRSQSIVLWGPRNDDNGNFTMKKYVHEMLDAQVHVRIKKISNDEIVFDNIGTNGGLEIEL